MNTFRNKITIAIQLMSYGVVILLELYFFVPLKLILFLAIVVLKSQLFFFTKGMLHTSCKQKKKSISL